MVGERLQPPKRIETTPEPTLATAISCLPSLLKSPTATDRGPVPTLTSVVPLKLPAPSPKRIETLNGGDWLATAISCMPSLLKSPTATETGVKPTLTLVVLLKFPTPSPKRIETV